MQTTEIIVAKEFCVHHNIQLSFLYALSDYGLLEISESGQEVYIHTHELSDLEWMVQLNQEMDINLEGIQTIQHLLMQMKQMQLEMVELKNRLKIYEG